MEKVVVIGNGMVGYKFCEKIRLKAGADKIQLVVFGEEPVPAYDRVHLSEYFTDPSAERLSMAPANWYRENHIDLRTGELVVTIDRNQKKVITHLGHEEHYDTLILATGSSPLVPPIDGVNKVGVFVYRTLEDLNNIMAYGTKAKSAAVLGGGLLGLEAAKALMDMGLKTHVIEFASRLMPRQLDDTGAEILKNQLEDIGLSIHLNKNTTALLGEGALDCLSFSDNTHLSTDMLVISCGIVPRDELASSCGLSTGPRGGVIVNEKLKTDDPNIYAIGEAALFNNMIYGLVAPGYDMAESVAQQLTASGDKVFDGSDMSTKLKLIGIEVGSFGDAMGDTEGCKTVVYKNESTGIYKKITISGDKKQLLGGILVGDTSEYNMLWQIMNNSTVLPPDPEDLILGDRSAEGGGGGSITTLPDTAQVCSCEDVTKADIVKAIREERIEDLKAVKTCTKAGTGCGACGPMVADIFHDTVAAMGKRVRKVICEHLDYTRQELYDLIRIKEIKTYDHLLDSYGKGDGCEVCKPAVASLLASIWNDLIVNQDTIQDTNDRFLANIQKGGSYSVVPRVPGGEITPEKLIVLGQVAKKYNLYSKITGGQRIDLFGARLEDLPSIWEELIAVGFESGHAYGKSLRTVKSCVGSAWCRFGLHDSVSFAIEVENRYRGLRAPHKLKGGVSGCRRECAEAQSKDFGIIATEVGWNLYICGNGGANPQHAQLLAGDLDSETCVKYLDRFLMFYIKTAEPLNRTATWLNKLEGGLDYVKDVIVNDCLRIGAELEKEMQYLVDTYSCEWAEVVKNDALKAKFSHFINTDAGDPTQKFDSIRGQKVPAAW
ncbi:nitrite reductase large subunit [Fulvivirga sp. M361]|uniref:nitrite reductase large subunit NirB n=1 Tax=Fulvivirga sp. M361 TaxID=2594266 RepID=UPI00117A4935|nr:nitrite reductase large subunit NirB [Fulvivirga sp. M361]TRX59008.1 nitrite reductase large subunit [Fulvivirga sp. M361]